MLPPQVREELRRLAASSRTRVVPATRSEPCDWKPWTVKHPRTGEYFTDAGGWEFVAEILATDVEVELVVLEKPKGKTGYVIKTPGCPGEPEIYIKLRIGTGAVI